MRTRKLHINTPRGMQLLPTDWVYKSNKEKNEWLGSHGFEIEDLEEQPMVTLHLEEVA